MDIFELLAKGEQAERDHETRLKEYEDEDKVANKVKKLSPFDFLNSLYMKDYIMNEDVKSQYQQFMVNRGMSNGLDTLVHAYIMDQAGSRLSPEMHYDYYYHAIRKGKRYNSWAKEPKYDYVDVVMAVYELSKQKAIDVMKRLSMEELEQLSTWFESRKGGITR